MAKLTAHPLAAHPLMPPSSSSSAENDKVILPFSKRVIDNNAASSSEGNGMMNNNQMMRNETTKSSAGTIAVQNVPLPPHEKEGRNEVQHNKPLSSQPPAAKPTSSNTLTAKASIKIKAKKKKQDQLNQLPRSIRWRLSLGLLTMPSTDNSSNNTNNTTTTTTADDKKSINHSSGTLPAKDLIFDSPNQLKEANKSQEESSSAAASLLQYIEDSNALKLRCQRSRYEELEQKHYYSNTIMGIADSSGGQQQQQGVEAGGGGGEQQKQPQSSQQQSQQQLPHAAEAASPISSLAGNKTHVAPGDDPLSALLAASTTTNTTTSTYQGGGNGMFGFGKGNRNKKNQPVVAPPAAEDKPISEGDTTTTTTTTANNTTNQTSTKPNNNNTSGGGPNRRASDNSTENNEETACKGSRWADYYSTREVLDVIEKDLNRLPNDHYTIYHEWKRYNDDELIRKRVLESGGGSNNFQSGVETASSSATPTKKGERKVGRQKNRFGNSFKLKDSFNFGSNNNVNNPHAVHNHHSSMPGGGGDNKNAFWSNLISNQEDDEQEVDPIASPDVSRKERADRLSQLLFVYAREHPEIGYRQGMHETLSFILLALEMDLLEQCVEKEKNNWKRDIMELRRSGMGNRGGGGGMAGVDSSGQIVVVRLLDQNYLLHDAFALFECVMSALAPAYDAIPAGEDATAAILEKAKEERGESPMEAMVLKIMSKIRFVARDEALFGIVLCMPVPPQIYFAKWVRLMFGREVSGGMKSVLRLWDAFFDLAAKVEHREEEVTLSLALMNVLETAAASMIILIRDKLLRPTKAWDGTLTGDPDPNDGIAYLMNYPPIEDIDNFIKVIASLLLKEKSLSQMYERRVSQDEEERYHEQVEDPFATGTGKMHDQNRRPRQVAPLSPERGSMTAHQPPLYAPQPKVDVAESLGNFAAGLLDIGSRTVDAAISTYQKHQAEKQQHQSGLIDHPLQFGFNAPSRDRTPPRDRMGQGAGQVIGRSDDPYAVSYRNHTDGEPLEGQDIIVYNTNLRDSQTEEHSQKEESRGLPRDLSSSFTTKGSTSEPGNENHARSDSDLASSRGKNYLDTEEVSTSSIGIEQLENGDDTVNRRSGLNRPRSNSRSFSSRNQSAALRKSPKSLAQKLDKSVKTLMTHFEQQQRNMMEDLSTTSTAAGGTRIIPEEIWEAMAAIDAVKKELLNQDALETLER